MESPPARLGRCLGLPASLVGPLPAGLAAVPGGAARGCLDGRTGGRSARRSLPPSPPLAESVRWPGRDRAERRSVLPPVQRRERPYDLNGGDDEERRDC